METALDDAVAALAAEEDPVARQRRALEVWRLLVEAADSIAFTLMFNGMLAAYEPAIEALSHVITENTEAYQRLADAVISGDAVIAREAAVEVLGSATTGLLEAIDALEGQA